MPLDSELVRRARELARAAHRDQLRKASQLPYFTHLEAVAELLNAHGYDDDETLAVAYLHDLIEDQPEHIDALKNQMPPSVVECVEVLSEQKCDPDGRPLPKRARFRGYLAALKADTGAARRALPVSCADRIHNSVSLVADEQSGLGPFMRLSSRPGDLVEQLEELRQVYCGNVREALLVSFDRARSELRDTIRRWLPGRAVLLAADAHLGQFDKAGAPYVYHPISLALRARDETERMVALLHDVVEDSVWTLEALSREGFDASVVKAVDHLTRRKGESDDAFIERVALDRIATRVKLLDLEHNADLSRLVRASTKDGERRDRYLGAMRRLEHELRKRSLQVVLDDASRERLREHATLPNFEGHHVTLAHRVLPSDFDPTWVPGKAEIGSEVELQVLNAVRSETVEALIVEMAGSSVRPIDAGTLHVTLSRSKHARSKDANELLQAAARTPLRMTLRGELHWVDS